MVLPVVFDCHSDLLVCLCYVVCGLLVGYVCGLDGFCESLLVLLTFGLLVEFGLLRLFVRFDMFGLCYYFGLQFGVVWDFAWVWVWFACLVCFLVLGLLTWVGVDCVRVVCFLFV